jgi:hypothetical protein
MNYIRPEFPVEATARSFGYSVWLTFAPEAFSKVTKIRIWKLCFGLGPLPLYSTKIIFKTHLFHFICLTYYISTVPLSFSQTLKLLFFTVVTLTRNARSNRIVLIIQEGPSTLPMVTKGYPPQWNW